MNTTLANIRAGDAAAIAAAADILRRGGLVAFPTETVYGLGADAGDDKAVASIFAAKGRPRFNPLIVHVANQAAAEAFVTFPPLARELARTFWPGALTLVLPRKPDARLSLLVSAGLDTVAIRVPSHPLAHRLIEAVGRPIAAPSANASGEVSPTTAAHVSQSLGENVDLILDGGPTAHGIESTVIGFENDKPVMLRPGAVAREEIERVAGPVGTTQNDALSSPGRLPSHYAPHAHLRLNAEDVRGDETLLAFGAQPLNGAKHVLNLSPSSDLKEAAANLFAMLRKLDATGAASIAVMPIPEHGLGEAINDRLRRAASPAPMTILPDVSARLKDAAGPKGFSEDANEIAPHLVEWRGKYQGKTSLLLKPKTTAQVSAILKICNDTRTPIVPQGGNTGLVGGQIPFHGEVLLSLERMNAIRAVDAAGMTFSVEAGVTLMQAKQAASDVNCFFPLSLASEGTCTIGGNLSTNAGGVDVLRYGNARSLALGLEVVLADGRVLGLMTGLHKDNTGYDLKQLFIGAEGTLGVITAAVLKLYAKPETIETAFVAVRDPAAAVELLSRAQAATGGMVSAFELLPRIGLDFVLAHIPGTRDPLSAPSPWYVLIEATAGKDVGIKAAVESAISDAVAAGLATDVAIAVSEAQRAAFWKIRESMSEAQKPEGGSIKHDVSVAVKDAPAFLRDGIALVEKLVPGVRPVPFGHIGDGNIHFNFSVPKGGDSKAFLARWEEVSRAVHDLVHRFGGSISAEHGVGVMKRDEILRYKSPEAIEAMRALKRAFDPNNILNPGKVVAI